MESSWRREPLQAVVSYVAKGIPPAYVEVEGDNVVRVLNQKCNRDFSISYTESRLHDLNQRKVPQEKNIVIMADEAHRFHQKTAPQRRYLAITSIFTI
jgi:type I restriction enzyme S subunit